MQTKPVEVRPLSTAQPASRRRRIWIVPITIVMGLLVISGGVLGALVALSPASIIPKRNTPQEARSIGPETPAERKQVITQGFSQAAVKKGFAARAVLSLLEKYGQAARAYSSEEVLALVDIPRLLSRINNGSSQAELQARLDERIEYLSTEHLFIPVTAQHFRLRSMTRLADESILVCAYAWSDETYVWEMRFWITARDGYKLYDWEATEIGPPVSQKLGATLLMPTDDAYDDQFRYEISLGEVSKLLEDGETDKALVKIGKTYNLCPEEPAIRDVCLTELAYACLRGRDYASARSFAAEVAVPEEHPGAWYAQAMAHHGLGNFDQALASLDQFDAVLPNSPKSAELRAELLIAQGKTEQAVDVLLPSLAWQPNELEHLRKVQGLLPYGQEDRLGQALTHLEDPTTVAAECLSGLDSHWPAIQVLGEFIRTHARDEQLRLGAKARQLELLGQWPAAADLYLQALKSSSGDTEQRHRILYDYLYCMYLNRQFVETYQSLPDSQEIYDYFYYQVEDDETELTSAELDNYRSMLELHYKQQDSDLSTALHWTRALKDKGDYPEALRVLDAVNATDVDKSTLDEIQSLRAELLVLTGQHERAFTLALQSESGVHRRLVQAWLDQGKPEWITKLREGDFGKQIQGPYRHLLVAEENMRLGNHAAAASVIADVFNHASSPQVNDYGLQSDCTNLLTSMAGTAIAKNCLHQLPDALLGRACYGWGESGQTDILEQIVKERRHAPEFAARALESLIPHLLAQHQYHRAFDLLQQTPNVLGSDTWRQLLDQSLAQQEMDLSQPASTAASVNDWHLQTLRTYLVEAARKLNRQDVALSAARLLWEESQDPQALMTQFVLMDDAAALAEFTQANPECKDQLQALRGNVQLAGRLKEPAFAGIFQDIPAVSTAFDPAKTAAILMPGPHPWTTADQAALLQALNAPPDAGRWYGTPPVEPDDAWDYQVNLARGVLFISQRAGRMSDKLYSPTPALKSAWDNHQKCLLLTWLPNAQDAEPALPAAGTIESGVRNRPIGPVEQSANASPPRSASGNAAPLGTSWPELRAACQALCQSGQGALMYQIEGEAAQFTARALVHDTAANQPFFSLVYHVDRVDVGRFWYSSPDDNAVTSRTGTLRLSLSERLAQIGPALPPGMLKIQVHLRCGPLSEPMWINVQKVNRQAYSETVVGTLESDSTLLPHATRGTLVEFSAHTMRDWAITQDGTQTLGSETLADFVARASSDSN